MARRDFPHATRAAVVLAAALVVGAPEAAGENQRSPKSSAKTETQAAAWQDCSRSGTSLPSDAVSKATEMLGQRWLMTDRGYFAAYTMAGEVRNPFDLSPKQPDSGPRDGIVQARAPVCVWRDAEQPGAISVRFTTAFYRFYETGHGWSSPLRNGLMLEALIERAGETWQARDASGEHGILLPDQKPRPANANALPADAPWAEPMPGCARKTKWNGEACVARKR